MSLLESINMCVLEEEDEEVEEDGTMCLAAADFTHPATLVTLSPAVFNTFLSLFTGGVRPARVHHHADTPG